MVQCPHCHQDVHEDHEQEQKKDANPLKVLSGILLIGGAVVALPCLALMVAGFGTAGIVGGSVAAATQSAIGNVVAGSAFAVVQSAGATGALVAGATGGLTAGAAGAVATVVEHNHNKEPEQHGKDGKENSGTHENKVSRTTIRCNHCQQEFAVSQ
jgi:hypothetical protein